MAASARSPGLAEFGEHRRNAIWMTFAASAGPSCAA
jgi:hypothetical protein